MGGAQADGSQACFLGSFSHTALPASSQKYPCLGPGWTWTSFPGTHSAKFHLPSEGWSVFGRSGLSPVICGFLASVPWTCCGLLRSRYGQIAGPSLPQQHHILQHAKPLGLSKNSPGWALSMRTLHLSHRRRLPPTVQLLVLPTEPL